MNEFEKLIIEKIDNIQTDVTDLKIENVKQTIDIARNTESLDHHIKRTDLLEDSLSNTKKAIGKKLAEIEEPRNTAKSVAKFLRWSFGIISVVAGGLYGIFRLYNLK